MLQQSPVNLACSRLASFLLFQLFSVGHVAFCCILLLEISTFTATLICTFFPPLSSYRINVLLVFFLLYVSLLSPSCNSSTYVSSHLLSKQLGFLNSRLWQQHTAHLSRQRVAMKWPTSQHHRVIVLCAVSMALTHLPLGREKNMYSPSSPCMAKRLSDLDWVVKRWAFSSSQAHTRGHSLRGAGSPQLWNYKKDTQHIRLSLAEDYG